ncbi:MAG TPA: sigma-54-dependent Fis family transcriptional regulator, partial [Myxococcales bacterium]|nr:sigma-54-dependent Fis family transcriptional regulator [Myxococcales bacterium]
ENVIERAIILCRGEVLGEEDLDFGLRRAGAVSPATLPGALEDLEKRKLLEAIEKHRGRKSDVARELGINRSTLYYRLKKFGLE